MGWRPNHDWLLGAVLPARPSPAIPLAHIEAAQLSTCEHCETLCVLVEGANTPHYFRRREKEEERVVSTIPPCVTAPAYFRAPW